MDANTFKDMLQTLGLPGAFMVSIIWFFWRFFQWAQPMVEAVVKRHVEFVDSLEKQTDELTECMKRVETTIRRLPDGCLARAALDHTQTHKETET